MTKQKQPRGFSIFFLTEMWERYGFYILQSLLVFYASQKLNLKDSETYTLVGSFTALAYVNSIFGGLIADRFIGYDNAILSGAALLCSGYLTLTVSNSIDIFILGLAIVTVGTGMLKPNISSMLSILYKNTPEKKDIGYTIFYIGIYFGAIGGSFLGGYIKQYLGWPAVFLSAAIGLAISFVTFMYGKRRFELHDTRDINQSKTSALKALISICGLILIAFYGLKSSFISALLFIVIAVLSLLYLGYNIKIHSGQERKKLIAFTILTTFSVLYWAVYFQQFFSVSLCTSRVTNLTIPESSLTSFESLGIILFGPLVNSLWSWLHKKNHDISITAKFSLSFLLNSIAFLVLILSLQYAIEHNIQENQIFIILCYIIISFGELFLAPIGLSMVSSLTPQKLNGAMMGIFLMSIGLGGKLAGILAEVSVTDNNLQMCALEAVYRDSFIIYCGISILIFIICLLMIKPINKLIQGK